MAEIEDTLTARVLMFFTHYGKWKSFRLLTTTLVWFLSVVLHSLLGVTEDQFCGRRPPRTLAFPYFGLQVGCLWLFLYLLVSTFLATVNTANLILLRTLPESYRTFLAPDRCVVVTISRNRGSTTTCNVFCRKIDISGSGEGKPFQLRKLGNRSFWTNEEITTEGIKVGCLLNYQVVACCQCLSRRRCKLGRLDGEHFFFCSNAGCKPQNVDKILLDLQDDESVYRGLKEAHGYVVPVFHRLQAYLACTRIFFIGIRAGTINNERVTLETINGEWLIDMPLNCRESLVLSTGPVPLHLKRPWEEADDVVGGVAVVKYEDGEATCEGLILRYKPLVISRDEELVEMQNAFGEVIPVPGHLRVLFNNGNEVATCISRDILLELNLQPDPTRVILHQFETVEVVFIIRGHHFHVRALVDAVGEGIIVGMDIIQQLYDLGYTIGN